MKVTTFLKLHPSDMPRRTGLLADVASVPGKALPIKENEGVVAYRSLADDAT